MRIRKRKVPLPLSLLSPIPLSDPNLFSRSSVMVVQGGGANTSYGDDTSIVTSLNSIHSQPSDHFPHDLIFVGNNSHKEVGEGNEVVPTSNDDASNAIITTTTRAGATPTVDNTNHNIAVIGGWRDDGDKAIPLKKRRGSFNNFVEDNNNTIATATVTVATANTAAATASMMIKIDVKNGDENEVNTTNNGNVNIVVASAKKGNNKRGNTIMEGSRCSRVNGRGWRCCQPTLVGYSLCEHHLGKGRLRSMTGGGTSSSNIKARSSGERKSNSISNGATKSPLGRDERKQVDNGDDEKKLEIKSSLGNNNNNNNNNNRKAKLGVVKARSLSSLLGQTNNSMSSLVGDLASMEHHEKVIEQL